MMLFSQRIILLFYLLFLSCDALRCTTRCSYTFNATTPFSIPDDCDQFVSVEKCLITFTFYYGTQEYTVRFLGDTSITNPISNDFRQAKLNLLSSTALFTYTIDRQCQDKDDCDRDLAKTIANEMRQQQHYNLNGIQNELTPFMLGPPLTSENSNLTCYDSNQNSISCGTTTNRGSCVISNSIFENKIIRVCGDKEIFSEPFVSIYQSQHYLSFDIQCNQSICNNQTTLQEVKAIMFKYGITVTPDGGLLNFGSKLIVSISSIIIMLLLTLVFNRIVC